MTISDKWYKILSYVGKIVLPALATLVITLFKVWYPETELGTMIGATIMALDVFLNALLGESSKDFYKAQVEEKKL